jgi:hypothetical protein
MSEPASNVVPFRTRTLTGKRRQIEIQPALALKWPVATKARYDLFDAWHYVAMRLARENKVGVHFLAVAKIVMLWKSGTITASNKHLADLAGGYSETVIKNEIAQFARMGVIVTKGSGRPGGQPGRVIRTRTIRLAFPAKLDPRIKLPDVEFEDEP